MGQAKSAMSIGVSLAAVAIGFAAMVNYAAAQSAQPEAGAAVIAQGKTLVDSGGCAGCHTAAGAPAFSGNVLGTWNAPSLLNDPHNGLGTWTADDIAAYLRTGHNRYADASGPMAAIITGSTSKLSAADADAIGAYLKSLPAPAAGATAAALPATDPAMAAGQHIYTDECAACHTEAGTGLANLFPSLVASPVVAAAQPVTLVHVLLHGAQSVGTAQATAAAMPAFGGQMSDQQIADVLTYIRNSWGNAAPAVTAAQVTAAR
ncbi:MAG: c-type cytochrome [Acidocella sp.]|nr:c-type cytochrome [Acidocella sp.]